MSHVCLSFYKEFKLLNTLPTFCINEEFRYNLLISYLKNRKQHNWINNELKWKTSTLWSTSAKDHILHYNPRILKIYQINYSNIARYLHSKLVSYADEY